MSDRKVPEVVVVGGGFGGFEAVKALRHADVNITLLDRRNHYLFQPLLYQVATAALNPADIAAPLREVLSRQANVSVFLANAQRVDADAKKVILSDGEVPYDYLVVATGATHSYFGHDDWERWAPGLKSIEDAIEIRRRVLFAYEAAERETDEERRRAWMTFVVVGAGPTGAELAGAFCEIARWAMARNFRRINPSDARIILVEGEANILPSYVKELTDKAQRQLEKLGTEVLTSQRVTQIDSHGVTVGDRVIPARTVVWAAGVQASPLVKSLGVPLDRAGRLIVQPDLSVPGHREIMVIGDTAAYNQDGKHVFGVAPAAMQAGRYAADRIRHLMRGEPVKPFHYVDKGSLATLGRRAGIADIKGIRLSGFIAWLAWLFIHLLFLIRFRNRLMVFVEWAWSYLTFQRGARLITGTLPPANDVDAMTPMRTTPQREQQPASTSR